MKPRFPVVVIAPTPLSVLLVGSCVAACVVDSISFVVIASSLKPGHSISFTQTFSLFLKNPGTQ